MTRFDELRARMVEHHLARRGIADGRVLDAFLAVSREIFVPADLAEFAYEDAPLPIGEGQTISQPYIVAVTLEAMALGENDRVLEVGTGSGYAAAILGRIAREVHTIERIESLAELARGRLARLACANVEVHCGDGSLGFPDAAPYDAIAVAAGGPKIPEALRAQLAIGGRLVIPVGADVESQRLLRVTRVSDTEYYEEELAHVRFVPLIGAEGWDDAPPAARAPSRATRANPLAELVREVAEPFDATQYGSLDAVLERIADARIVLIGEATHGTSEFHRMRARITQELIARRGFELVAIEADWADAARVNDWICGRGPVVDDRPFERFPTWMWRNEDVFSFCAWLRDRNAASRGVNVGFHGLDLYGMFTSIAAALAYLDEVDPHAARVARHRHGSLTPWQKDPSAYGKAALVGRYESSEAPIVRMLREMLSSRVEHAKDDAPCLDSAYHARVVANAERYYRAMYYGNMTSWNLRDAHMFDTLQSLLAVHGPASKAVVWAHNSHVGDARATEMSSRGENNVGQLARKTFGDRAYLIGFGTDHGTVAAASGWDSPLSAMRVRPAHLDSWERVFHDVGMAAFTTHVRDPGRRDVREELAQWRLERAIGVVYRAETELASHYFQASLARQFDEYLFIDETTAAPALDPTRAFPPRAG